MFKELDLDLLQLSPLRRGHGVPHPTPAEVETLRVHGVIQPVCARPIPGSGPQRYELLSGETTWAAAQLIGLPRLPVFVREHLSDAAAGAILNTADAAGQGENAVARARRIQRLFDAAPKMTRSALAARLGMTLSNLSHHLRLLELPPEVQQMVEAGRLQYGHARALLALASPGDQVKLARVASRRRLSVRAVEAAARRMLSAGLSADEAVRAAKTAKSGSAREGAVEAGASPGVAGTAQPEKDPNIAHLEARLAEHLGSPVAIEDRAGQGALTIRYGSLDVLDGILHHLGLPDLA